MDTLEDAVRSDSIYRVRQVLVRGVSQAELDYALITACCNRSLEIATLLLDRGAAVNGDPDNENGHFSTPLHQATLHCNVPLVTLLAARGADINLVANGRTALSLAAGSVDHFPILKALIDAGADPNITGMHSAPLNIAVLARNEIALTALLAAHANPNYHNAQTPSALHLAAMLSLPRFVEVLLAAGASPGMGPHRLILSPLQSAVQADRFGADGIEVVRLMLRAGADPMERGALGKRPLLEAAARATVLAPEYSRMKAALGAAGALLVASGDRDQLVSLPRPWPGMEAAVAAVWQAEPQALPALFGTLEPWAQEAVRCLLRMSHRYGLPKELRWRLAGEALGDAGRDLGLY